MDFTYQPVERYRAIMALLFCHLQMLSILTSERFCHSNGLNGSKSGRVIIKCLLPADATLTHCSKSLVFTNVGKIRFSGNKLTLKPFPNDKILNFSKLKEFADDNFRCDEYGRNFSRKGRKHCEKRRNCSLRAISPFLSVFSKDLYCRHVKTRAILGKG